MNSIGSLSLRRQLAHVNALAAQSCHGHARAALPVTPFTAHLGGGALQCSVTEAVVTQIKESGYADQDVTARQLWPWAMFETLMTPHAGAGRLGAQ